MPVAGPCLRSGRWLQRRAALLALALVAVEAAEFNGTAPAPALRGGSASGPTEAHREALAEVGQQQQRRPQQLAEVGQQRPQRQQQQQQQTWEIEGPCLPDVSDTACVTSPNWPGQYGNKEHCALSVLGESQRFLEVTDFETEVGLDVLTVNGERFAGTSEAVIHVQGQAINTTIDWASDSSQAFAGWRLCARAAPPAPGSWSSIGPCRRAPDDAACMTSPNFPEQYGEGELCTMQIVGAATKYADVVAFDTEARWDYLEIGAKQYSGTMAEVTLLQGMSLDSIVLWKSDVGIQRGGWKLCARDVPPTTTVTTTTTAKDGAWIVEGPCGVDDNNSACVTSPYFPDNYGQDQECHLLIAGGGVRYLTIDSFETEMGYDFLSIGDQVFSGSRDQVKGLHGIRLEGEMKWISDNSGHMSGWKLCAQEDPLPTTTYTTTSAQAGAWVVIGDCEVDSGDAACVASGGFSAGADYGNDAQCTMSIYGGGSKFLEVLFFETEEAHDVLTVGGQEFSGHYSEAMWGLLLEQEGDLLTWRTDGSQGGAGWKICARDTLPSSTTTTTTYAARHSWKDMGPKP